MRLLDRYLAGWLLGFLFLLGVVFALLFGLFAFVAELDRVGRGTYTLSGALSFVLLTTGTRLYDLLPVVSFLGVLLALGGLADRNELLALEALGVSRRRMLRVVLLTLISVLAVSFVLEEWGFSALSRRAWQLRSRALSPQGLTLYGEGFWAREGEVFLRVERIMEHGFLSGVSLFTFRDGVLASVVEAPLGRVTGKRWVLWSATRLEFSPRGVRRRTVPRLEVRAPLGQAQVETLAIPPAFLSLRELWRYRRALEQGGQDAYRYRLLFWQRMAVPVTALALVLLAAGFVFGPPRERGAGFRLSLGVLLGLFVHLGREVLSHAGVVFALPAPAVALLPPGIILLLALVRAKRAG